MSQAMCIDNCDCEWTDAERLEKMKEQVANLLKLNEIMMNTNDEQQTELNRLRGLLPENKRQTEEITALRRQLDAGGGNPDLAIEIDQLRRRLATAEYTIRQLNRNQVGKINGRLGYWSSMQRSVAAFNAWIEKCDSKGFLDPPTAGFNSMRTVKPGKKQAYIKFFKKNAHVVYHTRNRHYNRHGHEYHERI